MESSSAIGTFFANLARVHRLANPHAETTDDSGRRIPLYEHESSDKKLAETAQEAVAELLLSIPSALQEARRLPDAFEAAGTRLHGFIASIRGQFPTLETSSAPRPENLTEKAMRVSRLRDRAVDRKAFSSEFGREMVDAAERGTLFRGLGIDRETFRSSDVAARAVLIDAATQGGNLKPRELIELAGALDFELQVYPAP